MSDYRVKVLPEGHTLEAAAGETLLHVLQRARMPIRSACGGNGVCGRCSVNLLGGEEPEGALACQLTVQGDISIEIPTTSRLEPWLRDHPDFPWYTPPKLSLEPRAGARPMLQVLELALPAPSASDNVADLERLQRALKSAQPDRNISIPAALARLLPRVLRESEWKASVCVARTSTDQLCVTDVRGVSRPARALALALDCGTTTVEAALLDVAAGTIVGHAACPNPQSAYGVDIISRIVHAQRRAGLLSLHRAVREAIRRLTEQTLQAAGSTWQDLQLILAAGNTTMLHLLHHADPSNLRKAPYVPAFTSWPPVPLPELGMSGAPGSLLMTLPSVSSYVGGDVVSGLLATGAADSSRPVAMIDLGTNGEIAVGCRDWMLCCASSAGPCFEGGGVTWGCPAVPGAIRSVEIDAGDRSGIRYATIGEQSPIGLCGSGVLELMAVLFESGVVDRQGKIQKGSHPSVRPSKYGELEVVVVPAVDTPTGEDIVFTDEDAANVVRAKAAIFSGLERCLEASGLAQEDLEWLAIAGGFGSSLNVEHGIAIGLLPPISHDRVRPAGNTSIAGAGLALLDEEVWAKAAPLAHMMTTLELSGDSRYMDCYTAALFIPHTDVTRFESGSPGATADEAETAEQEPTETLKEARDKESHDGSTTSPDGPPVK